MIEFLIFFQLLLTQNGFLVGASIRSGKAKASVENGDILKEQSSNQISVKEEKLKSEVDQFYYLPLQTVFGETHTLAGDGSVSTTSPPHLSINPAPIQTIYQDSTSVLYENAPTNEYYNDPNQSQCVSETPIIELESHLLFPSRDMTKKSVIMSGHLEIASKTNSFEDVSEKNNIASKPSIVLQGTELHSYTITDL